MSDSLNGVSSITPQADSSYDIGSDTLRFGTVYCDDLVRTNKVPMADIYWSGNAVTSDVTVLGTYVKVNVTGGLTTLSSFEQPTGSWDLNGVENRLRYIGPLTLNAHVAATVTVNIPGAIDVIGVRVFKNGVNIPGSEVRFESDNGGQVHSSAIHCLTSMTTNDFLELYITNFSDLADDPIVLSANLFATLM